MVGHDHKITKFYKWKMIRYFQLKFFCKFAYFSQNHFSVCYFTKKMPAILGANRYEIGCIAPVIPIF